MNTYEDVDKQPGDAMSNTISVIIPVLREAGTINDLLDHLASLRSSHPVEIIVVDGAAEKDTLAAVTSTAVKLLATARGRGVQMNAGAAAAQGDVLLFLHADTFLPLTGLLDIERIMDDKQFAAGAFDLGIDSTHWFLRAASRVGTVRSRLTRIPYGDQAIFVRRSFFKQLNGYRDLALMEDVDLMQRIKKTGNRICILPKKVTTSARRWNRDGAIRGTMRNWVLVSLYLVGVPPERLAKYYR